MNRKQTASTTTPTQWFASLPKADKDGMVPVTVTLRLTPQNLGAIAARCMKSGESLEQVLSETLNTGKDLVDTTLNA